MRLRLIISFVLIVALTTIAMVLIAEQGAQREVRAFMNSGGLARLESIAASLEYYYAEHGAWDGAEALLQITSHTTGGQGQEQGAASGQGQGSGMGGQLFLADAQGTLLAKSTGEPVSGSLSESEIARSLPLKAGLRTVGYLYFLGAGGYSSSDEAVLVSRLTQAAWTAGLVAGGLALLLALYLATRLLRPVQALTHAAHGMAQGDLSQRVQVEGKDEMAELARSFNFMADSLQNAQSSRRAMTADLAHELRTPLAVQRASLEALQDGVYPMTAENLAPILEQNHLLTHLVDDLRTLAMADSGQLKLERTPTDLAALAGRVAARFHAQAEAQSVSLLVNPAALPELSLDPYRMEQILSNLISNALRFTPPGGWIHLDFSLSAGQVQLSVHDSGPGIPPEALPVLFERFYRHDKSRSRQEGGSGLGLAIARQLAEAHGGALQAANHPQGGAVFTLSLPLK